MRSVIVVALLLAAFCLTGCSNSAAGDGDAKAADMTQDELPGNPVDTVMPEVTPDIVDVKPEAGPTDLAVLDEVTKVEEIAVDLPPEIVVPPDGLPFAEGPYGVKPYATAGPFVVPTLAGDWDFEKEWSFGKDNYVFITHAKGNSYVNELLASSVKDMLKTSPANTHYFFLSVDSKAKDHIAEIHAKVQDEMALMEDWEAIAWEPRLHFVPVPVQTLDNWLGEVGKSYSDYTYAIDRFQRFRETGLLKSIGGSEKVEMRNLAYEVIHFNYEHQRDTKIAEAENVTVVPIFEEEFFGGNGYAEIELPDAETMAQFDTMEFDLTMGCKDNIDWNCGDWDYLAWLFVCDVDDTEKCGTEIGRWITAYKRGGRWVTDASSMLAVLKDGGKRRFRYDASSQGYVMSIYLRLSNQGKGERPVGYQFLWGGGGFGPGYNAGHPPINFEVPDGTSRVELFAYITGHGFGGDWANCAEFCNHTHHFRVNGGKEQAKKHPEAGTASGCTYQVKDGVLPNQFGTWPFGRGGWCPGFDVKPFVADFTSDIIDGENTITYESLHKGVEFDPAGRGANIKMTSYLVFWESM